ncbi:MAG: diacylglycerol kinase family lipid kinase [Clostridia bacterium]|nr:diacylglycerol kinase family lipid kinase [Clostridia bacterium]
MILDFVSEKGYNQLSTEKGAAEMKNMLFIINSASGKLALEDTLMNVVEIFSKADYDVTIHLTKGEGDIESLLKETSGRYELIVCCGGDGTLNIVAGTVFKEGLDVRIGYIPGGTTNDFAASHKIDTVTTVAATQIAEGIEREVDLGILNGNPFVYVAAFGMFSDVSYQTDREMKKVMGHAAYVFEGIKSFAKAKPYPLKIEYDGKTVEGDFIYGMISNSRRIGGFELPILKNILYDDGEMEVTLVKKPKTALETQKLINCLINQAPDDETVYMFKTAGLKITSENDIPWSLDGEFGGIFSDIDISVECAAIKMIF